MGIYLSSFIGLLVIACAHFFVGRVFAIEKIRGILLDALTGVAIAYAFVDVFPHLASMQAKLDLITESGVFAYLAHHVYLMALLGFILYLGIKTSLTEDTMKGRVGKRRHLVLVSSMGLYSYLIGYMLAEQPTHRVEPAIIFAIAMAAHVLGLNYENRRPDPESYDRVYRYMLTASVLLGWLTGVFFEMSDAVYSLWFAFLAGAIVSAGVATELPRVRSRDSFGAFSIGALMFCVLILVLEAMRG